MSEEWVAQLQNTDPERRKKAITALARAKDRRALKPLAELYRSDPDEGVRKLALKAGNFINANAKDLPPELPEVDVFFLEREDEDQDINDDLDDPRHAGVHYRQAREYHQAGNRRDAVRSLGRALDVNPRLTREVQIQRLAAAITGLPLKDAVHVLRDFNRRAEFLKTGRNTGGTGAKAGAPRSLLVGMGLVIVAVVAVVLVARFVSGELSNTFVGPAARSDVRRLAAEPFTEYHLGVPGGLPTAFGWPTLVAIHGPGQSGADMVELFGDAARKARIVLVAPTFPDMQDAPYERNGSGFYSANAQALTLILDEIDRELGDGLPAMSVFGPVMFGNQAGGMFVTRYMQDQFLPVAGVALANGGPGFFEPPFINATEEYLPYLIIAGEDAPRAQLSRDYADNLRDFGLVVDLRVEEGAGADLTKQQVEMIIDFVREIYDPGGPIE